MLATLLLAAACSGGKAPPVEIRGTWTAVSIDGHPVHQPAPTLTLGANSLDAFDGCNDEGGYTPSVSGNTLVITGGRSVTAVICGGATAAQASRFRAIVWGHPTLQVVDDDQLALRSDDGELLMGRPSEGVGNSVPHPEVMDVLPIKVAQLGESGGGLWATGVTGPNGPRAGPKVSSARPAFFEPTNLSIHEPYALMPAGAGIPQSSASSPSRRSTTSTGALGSFNASRYRPMTSMLCWWPD